MHLFSSIMKMLKKGRDQRKTVSNVKWQSSLDFAPKHRVAEEQSWSSFKGWCHLPGLSDVEIGKGLLKLGYEWYVQSGSDHQFSIMQSETVKLKGLARTQIPTNKNNDVEFPTFGEIAGVNHSLVQWSSLALEEPPS